MKKTSFLIFMAILLSANVNSQIRFGLRGGINTAYFNATEIIYDQQSFTTLNDANVGFHAGVMAQINFIGMFLQPELLFSSISSDVRVRDLSSPTGTIDQIRSQSYNKLDFPILVGARFGAARVGVGPVGTFMLSSNSELNEYGLSEKFNSATFGFQIGAGVDVLSRIALDLKYEGNLSRLGSGVTIAGQEREFDSRARQLIFSIGVFF